MGSRSCGLWCCALLLLGICSLAAQSKKPEDLAAGKLLVIPRDPPDPLFAESVILLVRYNERAALGLMVNRPTKVPISDALRELDGAAARTDTAFVGGPVELGTVFALTRAAQRPEGTSEIFGDIYLVSGKPALEKALRSGASQNDLRIYVGYCGWGPGQLDNEVLHGGWYIFDHNEDLAFDAQPRTLWSRLVDKAEARIARFNFTSPRSLRPIASAWH